MRFDPAHQDVVAIDNEVMRCNRCGEPLIDGLCIGHAVGCGDMFHDDTQLRDCAAQWVKDGINKHSLAIKDVDVVFGDFAVNTQGTSNFSHAFQNRAHIFEITNP